MSPARVIPLGVYDHPAPESDPAGVHSILVYRDGDLMNPILLEQLRLAVKLEAWQARVSEWFAGVLDGL